MRLELERAIGQADVALLLLSADFFGSDGLLNAEIPQLLERHRSGKLHVIPILLRSCVWEVHPWLAELQPLPRNRKPIASMTGDERDRVLTEVVSEIVGLAMPSGTTGVDFSSEADSWIVAESTTTDSVRTGLNEAAQSNLASVYLSYGDEDLPAARRLHAALEAAAVPVFFRHEHAVPGAKIHRVARRNIREYEHVILLCSERSLRTPSVVSELDEMLSREFDDGASERIIPVLLDNYVFQGWQPRHPDIRQSVLDRVPLDLKGTEQDRVKFEKGMKRLLGALKDG
jgi:hypothetical protein